MSQPPYTLPDLPYPADALEPFISGRIMTLHHDKHHKAYVDALNEAERGYVAAPTIKERIALQAAIRFNGGGHINHSLFWTILAPSQSKAGGPGGDLSQAPSLVKAIESQFGSFDKFRGEFNDTTKKIQGSGWGWLGYNPRTGLLQIETTGNQDPLLSLAPIIGVDVWEHAYYLDYENRRPDYLNAIWYVINFAEAEARFVKARAPGGGHL